MKEGCRRQAGEEAPATLGSGQGWRLTSNDESAPEELKTWLQSPRAKGEQSRCPTSGSSDSLHHLAQPYDFNTLLAGGQHPLASTGKTVFPLSLSFSLAWAEAMPSSQMGNGER